MFYISAKYTCKADSSGVAVVVYFISQPLFSVIGLMVQ